MSGFQSSSYSHMAQCQQQGSSGLKIFEGEDLTAGDRRRLQQLQSDQWWRQQQEQKQQSLLKLQQEKQAFDQHSLNVADMRRQLQEEKAKRLREMQIATKQTNAQQLEERICRLAKQRELEAEQKINHVNYLLQHDVMTENTNTCQSYFGKNRVLPYHWKGMNTEQRNSILEEQEKQRQQKLLQQELQKQEERLFADQIQAQRKAVVLQDRAKNHGLQNLRKGMDEYNRLKAEEMKRKAFNAYHGTQTYKNQG